MQSNETSLGEPAKWSAEERANVAVVNELMAALRSCDAARIAGMFTSDATFTMGPIGELPPPAPVDLSVLARCTRIEIDVLKTFASGPIVMMDRHDRLIWPERTVSGRWIGIFAVKEGKVAAFTDYTIERTETRAR
jgi:limonene-1,2-epoxide hydrolase